MHAPDAGSIDRASTTVHVIHQTLGLIDTLSAIENLDVVRRAGADLLVPFSRKAERARIESLLDRFGIELDPTIPVGRLTPAQRTVVAIVRALDGWDDGDHVLVLDEPTATLHDDETKVLLDTIRTIAAQGVGIIYISHRLGEVVDLADRAVVLRDGRVAAEFDRGAFDEQDLLGVIAESAHLTPSTRQSRPTGSVALRAIGLTGPSVRDIDLEIRRGEVVGIAGLIGSGMEEINSLLFGASVPERGRIDVAGRRIPLGDPAASIAAGLGYLPPDRLTRGGIATQSARENLTLPRLAPLRGWHGALRTRQEAAEVDTWMTRVKALPLGAGDQRLDLFSGGNQQKVLLAKWLRLVPTALLLDEPTQGVDVGARHDIHLLLREAAEQGAAVLIASSDTNELAEYCDRVLVIDSGRVQRELAAPDLDEAALIHAILSSRADDTTPNGAPVR